MDEKLSIFEEQVEILRQAYLKMMRQEYRKCLNYRKWKERRRKTKRRRRRRRRG